MVIIELVLPLCCQEPPSPFPSTVTSPGDRTEVLAVFPASTLESAISKLSSMCWCHVHPQLTSLVWLHPSEPQEGLRSPNSHSFHETPVKSTVTLKHVQREDTAPSHRGSRCSAPWAAPKIPAPPPARQLLPATGGGTNTALLELHRDSQPSWSAGL